MKRCWKLVPRADADAMSREEYEGMYSTLLYEMTICWDEEMNDVVLAKMWQRDASAFSDLDFNRFCCSIFYFAEMVGDCNRSSRSDRKLTFWLLLLQWVQEITQDGYTRIFGIIRTILSGHEFAPLSSSTEAADSTFMPTLETFDDAFDREKEMESMNLNIGKSIVFDAKKYFQQFGSPTATIQASNSNLFQLQERSARTVPPRGVLCEDYNRRYGTYESATKTKSGCSNPKLLRPTSSRQARLNSYSSSPTAPPDSPPPNTSRTAGTFLLAGTTALKPTTNM
ncbi:hypothetical protein ON010_g10510 [Phytophthora cinnamomi]|nr:hypothetical protein ON010_g10510 [Phytophthora cinnamomi]